MAETTPANNAGAAAEMTAACGGVCGCMRQRAANDGGADVQRTTVKATCSKLRRGSSGKDGGVRRGVQQCAVAYGGVRGPTAACSVGMRWRRRSSVLVLASCDDGKRGRGRSVVFASSTANCRRHEMLKP